MKKDLSKLSKKGYLDYIYYVLGKQKSDFWVCGTYIDDDGNKKFTKWKKYSEAIMCIDESNHTETWQEKKYFEQINQRQILPNEIVLDLEEPERLKKILDTLIKWGWKFNVFYTGSRGYHIHLLVDRIMNTKEKEAIVKKIGTDIQKCSEKNLIALEYQPHWKTGKKKEEIIYE